MLAAIAVLATTLAAQPATEVHAPNTWSVVQDAPTSDRFFFPRAGDAGTFVAIFPTKRLDGTLASTLTSVWHETIGNETVVDTQQRAIVSSDGAPALLEIVATVDGANRGIYRVFVVKQYGDRIASGEFRSDDPDKMQGVGDDALRMLQGMSVGK